MEKENQRVVIIGAGQAGAVATLSLRSFGYCGEITMIGAEAELPYERPELSKTYLSGTLPLEKLQVLSRKQVSELELTFRAMETVSEIKIDERRIVTSIGGGLTYDYLILATGGAPRQLEECLALRTRADADAIGERLRNTRSLGIVGAGWLGLELAAHARSHDIDTTVYERGETVCGRVLPRDVAEYVADHHRATGARLALGTAPDIAHIRASHDLTVACIGMTPHDSLARAAGIETDGGVLVDDAQRTSAPGIFAIGDCARLRNRNRIESWTYANRSAKRAAATIAGAKVVQEEPLWFWSKQGSLSIQLIGTWSQEMPVTAENVGNGGKLWHYEDAGHLVGLIAINSPRDFAKARRHFSQREGAMHASA